MGNEPSLRGILWGWKLWISTRQNSFASSYTASIQKRAILFYYTLGDLEHDTEVGGAHQFDHLRAGEIEVNDMGGLLDGGYKHVLVLKDCASRFVWLEEAVSFDGGGGTCSAEIMCLVWGTQGVHQ